MLSAVEQHLDDLRLLCERHHVRRLDLFGSAAAETGFDPARSDLDFLVEFLPLQPGGHADAYFGLLEGLETLFRRSVDLVMIHAVRNPYFRESVERGRRPVYAA